MSSAIAMTVTCKQKIKLFFHLYQKYFKYSYKTKQGDDVWKCKLHHTPKIQ